MNSAEQSAVLSANAVGILHNKLVLNRRVEVLANWFAKLLPSHVQVLDVGCGDGLISSLIGQHRPDITIRAIDVISRTRTHIPVDLRRLQLSFSGILI